MDVYYGDIDGDWRKDGMHIRDFDNDGILDAFQENSGNQQFSIETRDGVDYYVLDLDRGNTVRFIDHGMHNQRQNGLKLTCLKRPKLIIYPSRRTSSKFP